MIAEWFGCPGVRPLKEELAAPRRGAAPLYPAPEAREQISAGRAFPERGCVAQLRGDNIAAKDGTPAWEYAAKYHGPVRRNGAGERSHTNIRGFDADCLRRKRPFKSQFAQGPIFNQKNPQ